MIRRWDKSKPPRGIFTLNRGCPQAQGLVAWYPFGNRVTGVNFVHDAAGITHLTGVNAPSMRLGQYGEGVGSFVQASSQRFSGAMASLATVPLSISAWALPDSSVQTPICIAGTHAGGLGSTLTFQRIVLVSGVAWANSQHTQGAGASAVSATAYTPGAWNLFGATFAGIADRTIYTNGANPVNNTTSITAGTLVTTLISAGVDINSTFLQFMQGQVGECGVWNVALSAQIHARLYSPSTRYELSYPLRSPKWISFGAETPVATGTASVSGRGSLAALGVKAALGIALIAGSGAVAANGQKNATGSASTSGGGAVVATVSKAASGAVGVSTSGTIAAAGDKQAYSLSDISGGGSTTASGAAAHAGAAVVSSSGTVSAVGAKQAFSISSVSGSGEASASGVASAQTATGTASVSGSGSVTASGTRGALNSSAVSGGGAVVAAGTKQASGTSAVSGGGSVSAESVMLSGDPEWRYSVTADDLRYSITADDLRYSVAADDLRYRVLPHEGS